MSNRKIIEALAKDALILAALGGMPDSFWLTDRRIRRASTALDWTPQHARSWARRTADRIRQRRVQRRERAALA